MLTKRVIRSGELESAPNKRNYSERTLTPIEGCFRFLTAMKASAAEDLIAYHGKIDDMRQEFDYLGSVKKDARMHQRRNDLANQIQDYNNAIDFLFSRQPGRFEKFKEAFDAGFDFNAVKKTLLSQAEQPEDEHVYA